MIELVNIREWLKTLDAKADNYYVGTLNNKRDKSIGVYPMKQSSMAGYAIGGPENTKDEETFVTLLIHWSKNYAETDHFSRQLFSELMEVADADAGNYKIDCVQLMNREPVNVGPDDNGVYENVIDICIHYGEPGPKEVV